jgi:hypothetical protein
MLCDGFPFQDGIINTGRRESEEIGLGNDGVLFP